MHASIHISIAVSVSAFGELVVTLLKMLTSTRNSVISSAMRPGTGNITSDSDLNTRTPRGKVINNLFIRDRNKGPYKNVIYNAHFRYAGCIMLFMGT